MAGVVDLGKLKGLYGKSLLEKRALEKELELSRASESISAQQVEDLTAVIDDLQQAIKDAKHEKERTDAIGQQALLQLEQAKIQIKAIAEENEILRERLTRVMESKIGSHNAMLQISDLEGRLSASIQAKSDISSKLLQRIHELAIDNQRLREEVDALNEELVEIDSSDVESHFKREDTEHVKLVESFACAQDLIVRFESEVKDLVAERDSLREGLLKLRESVQNDERASRSMKRYARSPTGIMVGGGELNPISLDWAKT
mmetsp:Transcript_9618/g.19649  ORF Transcript_9618/g.19649 Transcript_9618/m.19649 type:complete len:260 (-) Transcript_9618:2409-3188(-)